MQIIPYSMQPRLFSCQVNDILDVTALGGTVDEEINPTTYTYTAALAETAGAVTSTSAGITIPSTSVKFGTAPATTANTGLSIQDFNTFRKLAASALNNLESKIDSILNISMVDCDVCG